MRDRPPAVLGRPRRRAEERQRPSGASRFGQHRFRLGYDLTMPDPPDRTAAFDIRRHVAEHEPGPRALGVRALLHLKVAIAARDAEAVADHAPAEAAASRTGAARANALQRFRRGEAASSWAARVRGDGRAGQARVQAVPPSGPSLLRRLPAPGTASAAQPQCAQAGAHEHLMRRWRRSRRSPFHDRQERRVFAFARTGSASHAAVNLMRAIAEWPRGERQGAAARDANTAFPDQRPRLHPRTKARRR